MRWLIFLGLGLAALAIVPTAQAWTKPGGADSGDIFETPGGGVNGPCEPIGFGTTPPFVNPNPDCLGSNPPPAPPPSEEGTE